MLVGEEWRRPQGPPGVRKSSDAVAGKRSRRSRFPVRHASSSPREGWQFEAGKDCHDAAEPAAYPLCTCCRVSIAIPQPQAMEPWAAPSDRPAST
ncbi:MAG: hypothetical protein DI537_06880 [Stutzerimonas stutzeri]|nr:MAG: hypothetical protein DI537_06880 [Stutzerimonas stutzeri]